MAQKRGTHLEKLLDLTHQLYKNQRRADISKREVKTIFDKKTGAMRYVKKEGFDYEGCVFGGHSISIEAKEGHERLRIEPNKGSGLKLHQLQALLFRGSLGGLACVIWMPTPNKTLLLDYTFLKNFHENIYNKATGAGGKPVKSITIKMAEEDGIQIPCRGLIDYLDHIM